MSANSRAHVTAATTAALTLLLATTAGAAPAAPRRPAAPAPLRYTAPTPEEMLRIAAERARRGGLEGIASIAVIAELAPRAPAGSATSILRALADGAPSEAAREARWAAAALSVEPSERRPAGLVRAWAILGPFQDTGGGLARREGPEAPDASFSARDRSYDRGAYRVRWRPVPPNVVTAAGIPLDLLVSPRKESCTYLASRITLAADGVLVAHVAGSGSLRLRWDDRDAALDEEDHAELGFDRIAARVEASRGEHLLVVKSCTGALDDAGRVRVRLTDGAGQPLAASASADLGPAASPAPTASVAAEDTPLARALRIGEDPPNHAALHAAIVRSLGGADDRRSPRAPGLLDRVARDPAVAPDVLAMAGWVTPFGADRSGRLNRAWSRATRAADARTAGFAQRRLAALRAAGGYPDWAMAAIAAPPLSEAADAEARLVKAVVLGSVRALRRAALRDLEALAALEPDRASVWLGVAEHAEAFDRQLAARAQEALRRLVPDASCGALVRSMRARGAEAVAAAARRCMQEGVSDSDELVGMGQALTESGQYDEARALYAAATELAPNVREVWTGLSLAAFATGRPEDVRAAEVALERARALEPGDARLGAEIKLRAAKRAGDDDEKLLVEPPALLAARAARPARPGEEADRQLYWLRRVRFLDDRRVAQTIHYAREVVIAPRTQRELQENLPAEGDTTEILRARVHRAAGGVAFAEEQDSDPHRPRVRWPQLERGDVVEVALRTFTAGPVGGRGDPPFYFFDYAGAPETHPLLYNEVVVDSPVASPLAIDVLNGKPDRREERVLAGRRVVRLLWDRPASVADEPLAPHLSEVVPVVVGSTFSSWKDFLDWYRAAVRGFTEPDEQVRRMAAEITKGAGGREEKLRRIFDYVADNVRYVNYTSGEWWLPNRPQQVLARRQGDCDDKAILLITLLKAVGIEATEVLVQTRFTAQPSVLRSKAAAIPLFDHGIAYLPGRAGAPARWLDATSPQSRLGPVPAMDARTLALFVDQGAPEVVATPPSAPSEHGVASRWTVRLDDAGGGEIEVEERHAGDHGFVLRNNLLEPDARSQWVEQNLLAGWFSGTKLDGKVRFEPDLGNGTARVGFSARSGAVARREASDLVVELAPATTMASQLAPLARRTLPVVLPPQYAPSHGTRVIRIVAPRGWTLGPLPPGGEERGGEFGTARLSLARDPARADAVVVTRQVDFDANVIAVDKYPAWRAWLQRVDALLHRGVRFVPPLAR